MAIIIVILIILAGVTINATIGEGGLIKQAQYASEQMANSTAYEQEQLNKLTGDLANITEGGEITPPDPGEEIPEGTITIGEPEWAGDGTASVTVSTSESGYILQYQINGTDEGSWQTVQGGKVTGLQSGDTIYTRITDGESSSSPQGKLIQDVTAPGKANIQLNKESLTAGEDLTATVTHTDNQSGVEITKSKWIMNTSSGNIGTNEGSYTGTFTSNGETITLDSSKTGEYYLHVLTVDKAGNKTETISNKIAIGGIIGTITQKGETTWSGGKATVELETVDSGFNIEYKVNEGSWVIYKGSITGLNHGDKITARLTNGVTVGAETEIDVKDEKGPIVAVTGGIVTTNSVTVNVVAEDMESGMTESVTYTYYIKKTGEEDTAYQEKAKGIAEKSYTFTGLEQGTSYDVKVEVQGDKAGNVGVGTVQNQRTDMVPGAGDNLEEGNIVASAPEWSNEKASITLTTSVEGMQIQYQVGGLEEGSWQTITSGGKVENLIHGDTVYARLTDGTNYGDYASVAILDGEAPENATIQLNTESLVVGSNLTAKVTHTDNQSGVEITQSKWVMNTNSGNIGTEETSYTGTFTSNGETITLDSSKTGEYYLHVLTVDKAGNKKETISNKITINGITGTVNQKGEATWSEGTASVELESTQGQYTIEYKINEGEWQDYTGTAITGLNHGDKITARLTNETVQGPETVIEVKDETNPTVLVTSGGTTTNSVVANVVASDNESGMAENVTYTYSIKETGQPDSAYNTPGNASNITANSYTFTGLTQGKSYDVKVEVQGDKAGNVGTGTLPNQQTSTIQGPSEGLEEGNIVASDPIWQNEKASITLTTSVEGMQIQYQVGAITEDGWTTISSGEKVENLLHGNTVYARLYDGTNYGDYASVTILDGTPPTVSVSQGEVTSNSITVNVTANDGQSGLATTGTYKYYIDDSLETTTETNTYTFTGLTPETQYTIKVEAIDKGNNTGSNTITVTTTRKIATNVKELEEAEYVIYESSQGEFVCRVLYDNASAYGIQVITNDVVESNVELGDSDDFTLSMNSYNNAISTLNSKANPYNNSIYSTRARCVGSIPNNPTQDDAGYFTSGYSYMSSYNRKYKNIDENYKTDYEQMEALGISAINGKSYWLTSRYVESGSENTTFYIRRVNNYGQLSNYALGYITSSGYTSSNKLSNGIRIVFVLRNTIKVTGGDGSAGNPYTLGFY